MPLTISPPSMAAEAARQSVINSESKSRQPRGSAALPETHITGESTWVVASRSAIIFCATGAAPTSGSSTDTDEMTVGKASEATIAVTQIQRVRARLK
jgi:hypothetical protein